MDLVNDKTSREFRHVAPTKAHFEKVSFKSGSSNEESSADTLDLSAGGEYTFQPIPLCIPEETPDATEKLVFVEPGSINRAQNQGSLNPLTLCTVESQCKFPNPGMCNQETIPVSNAAAKNYCDGDRNRMQFDAGDEIKRESGCVRWTLTDYSHMDLADRSMVLDLPTDQFRSLQKALTGAQLPIHTDAHLAQLLRKLAQDHDVDIFMIFLAAWSAVLSRLFSQNDLIIGFRCADVIHHDGVSKSRGDLLLLRMNLSRGPNTVQLLEQVRQTTSMARGHQDIVLEEIAEFAQPLVQGHHPVVFQAAFDWCDRGCHSSSGTLTQARENATVQFGLQLELQDVGDEIVGSLRYSANLFDSTTTEQYVGYLRNMLRGMVFDVMQPVTEIDLTSPVEQKLLLKTWNTTSSPYPEHQTIHSQFEEQVKQTPEATALVFEDQILTYAKLNARANCLAHHLIGLGIQPDERVAICMERSLEMILGLLAILKAGGAYVPIDLAYPSDRFIHILSDASPAILLADRAGQQALGETILASLIVVDPSLHHETADSNPYVPGLSPRHLAYVIYTSGSTGKPKGVMIEHRSVVNMAHAHTATFGVHRSSRVLQCASLSFDSSVSEIFMALTCGASLYLPSNSSRLDLSKLWGYLDTNSITHATFTPSILQDGKDLPNMNERLTLILGGEALNAALLRRLACHGPVFNDYGPTETTVGAIVWRASQDFSGDIVPIGRPHKNYRVYLLDVRMQPVPLGVIGEIYIGGVGVARGYLNRPELTAERFIPDPFVGDAEARMYKTGDLARCLPDGNLVYLGRNDDQVKIRGIRIETGEIEARLAEHAQVQEVAVVALGEENDKRLVAYVVAAPDRQLAYELRMHLMTRLPEYMIPAAFVRVDALPLNVNGKLDRRALPKPKPGDDAFARQAYEAPQGEAEIALAEIWAQLLGVEHISRHDNFFRLGGHSLLAVRVLERLQRLGLSVPVRTLFESPTLSVLAHALSVHKAVFTPPNLITLGSTALTPDMLPLIELTQSDISHIIHNVPGGLANIQDIYMLSPLQNGILFHHMLATEGDPYLVTTTMAFQSRELLDRYLSAFQRVIDRHDILRTMFIWENLSASAQVVCRRAPLSIMELALNPTDGPIMNQLDKRFNPRHYRIDLRKAPLVQFVAAQDTDGRWLLVQLMHHLIGDHAAAEMMNIEIQAFLKGQDQSLPTPRCFRDLVAQVRLKSNPEAHEHFFKEMLADVDEPTLPFGLTWVHNNGSKVSESHQMLPENLNVHLRSHAKRLGVSLASLCHVAWAQVLALTSGQQRVVFGTVLSGQLQSAGVSDQAMGLSINTLPFRCDMDNRDVQTCVQETHASLAALLEHEHAPLTLAQRCSGVPPGTALFSGLLNYRHTSLPSSNSPRKTGAEFWSQEEHVHYPGIEFLGGQERTNYPFTLSIEDFGMHLGLTVQVMHPVNPVRVRTYMQKSLESLVEALECKHSLPVSHLQVLPMEERNLLLSTWNETQQGYSEHHCIHHLFEQHAAHNPEAIALAFEDQSFTYAELNARANCLAHHLIGLGIQPDERVAICMERSLEMIIGLLAILKAGGAYVPIDLAYPSDRFIHILSDASPAILLADRAGQQALGEAILASLIVVDPSLHHETADSNPYVPGLSPRHLAYVIYTSGSTGKPKGVMIEHRSVVNMAHAHTATFGVHRSSRVLQFASLSFDTSVSEIFMALTCGASLYLPPDSARLDRSKLWEYLDTNSITYASFTPSLLQDGKDLPNTNEPLTLILGGEALNAALLRRLACHGPVFNDYGPTETTVSAIVWRASQDFSGDIVPIGRPHKNYRVYLLDVRMQPVPLGVIGEIYIGGVGVARGYLNRPELTAERFLPDPFFRDAEARMYKTGDLARYLPDGNLVYLGRNDDQVKIRGIRIETGEIEVRLAEHAQVQEVAVVALGEENDKRLVAYVVATPDRRLAHELRMHLMTRLPEYMIPAAFVRVDALPLNVNGKLNRRALPEPGEDAFARQEYEAPQGEVETLLAAIWAQLLGVEHISRHDNFFTLGGHSLLAVRLMNRITTLGIQLPLSALFSAPSLSALAELTCNQLIQAGAALPPITPGNRDAHLQPSYAQERLWFLAQMEGVSVAYHIPLAIRLRGALDREAWQCALNTLFARHDSLRSVFVSANDQLQVEILPAQSGLPMRWRNLQHQRDAETTFEQLSFEEVRMPFDLEKEPLIRAQMVQLAGSEYVFMLTQHHIISDGWSLGVLLQELGALYSAFCRGDSDPLAPLEIQYPDYAAWQRRWLTGDRLQDQSTYWLTTLTNAPVVLDLPSDRPRPPQQSFAGASVPVHLDAQLTQGLRQLSQKYGVTLFMTILAAWSAVLSRLSGQDDLVIGTPIANRTRREVEPLIGFFANTLALRIDLSGDPNTCQLLERVKHLTLAAHAHQDLPFQQVVEIVQPPRKQDHSPLFQVMFAWENKDIDDLIFAGLEASPVELGYDTVKFDLELELCEASDKIVGSLSYAVALFDRSTIERHAGYLRSMLQAMITDVGQSITNVDLLSQAERELILHSWNATQQGHSEQHCAHHLYEQRVAIAPEAIALVFEDQSLTYAELNARANRLAHHLIGLGIQPDERVAICMERSLEMIIGLLAILKAGGAYVPIDLAYPSERFIHILSDASPAILLADSAGQQALGEAILASLIVVDPSLHHETADSNPYVPGLSPRHLAYVIYTSGSTGKPKGVMVEHRSVVNMVHSYTTTFGVHQGSRVLQFATLSFDSSVSQIFVALSCGASLYLPSDSTRLDRSKLWEYLDTNSITYAHFTPSVLQDGKDLPNMNERLTLILGGEALNAALLRRLPCRGPVFNDYGPTETTVSAIVWRASQDFSGDIVPIGRPHKNYRVYILDTRMQPVPLGVMGELYISGVGVARGYLNRPELTAERFLPDPFAKDAEARMYKTGDLARYLPDGNLVYLGRNDDQVKIRGIRIETGEIEVRLAEHAQVQEVSVVALGEDNEKRLVAYVVATPDRRLAHELRMHLMTRLPEYMIPAAFVRVDALPLNTNGKLDRRALPKPGEDAFARQEYEAPDGEIEVAIANIWMELLNVEKIGRHDGFFMLGGHSLLALRMANRLRTMLGLEMNLRMLFEAPTIAELAKRILKSEGTQKGSYDVLLPIRSQGTRRPLFCVHHGYGISWCYIGLSTHLPTDQPVYGLQARGLFGDEQLPTTLDEMAADYILQIRSIQSNGPYYLLGYCFGGTVVHTMAKLLEEQGERVALVALMDTPADYHLYPFDNDEDDAEVIRLLAGRNEDVIPEVAKSFWENAPKTARNIRRLASQRAPPTYSGDILLFRATDLQEDMGPLICGEHWEPYVLGDIEVIDIHCAHNVMDHPQPMAEIGRILAQKLEALHHQEARNY